MANLEALRLDHGHVGTEHVVLGLIKEGSGVGVYVLANLDVDSHKICLEVDHFVKANAAVTPGAKDVIDYAIEEARSLNHKYVGTEHLLLGLLREEAGIAGRVLRSFGLATESVRGEIVKVLGNIETDDRDHGD